MKIYSANNLPPHCIKHSPTGMNWGYGGSGPADLALSVLVDCVGLKLANKFYQDFKWDFVSHWRDGWSVTEEEIKKWINLKIQKHEQL